MIAIYKIVVSRIVHSETKIGMLSKHYNCLQFYREDGSITRKSSDDGDYSGMDVFAVFGTHSVLISIFRVQLFDVCKSAVYRLVRDPYTNCHHINVHLNSLPKVKHLYTHNHSKPHLFYKCIC